MSNKVKWLMRISKVMVVALVMQLFAGVPAFAESISGLHVKKLGISNQAKIYSSSIYENYIVYDDFRNNNFDIYLYNLISKKEIRITNNSKRQVNPKIWGDKIVWEDNRNDEGDIYMYDLKTKKEYPIAVGPGFQTYPRIYENKIVWEDHRNNNADIYMYDLELKEERRITTDSSDQQYPAIYGDKIVWEDLRNFNRNIFVYDISAGEETPIEAPGEQYYPDIYEQKIVWADFRNENFDIYMYDLSNQTETQITSNSRSQEMPRIYGNYVVWNDVVHQEKADISNIYAYDLTNKTEIELTKDLRYEHSVVTYGDKIVWTGVRKNNFDLYMVDLSKKLQKLNIELRVGNPNMTINGETIEIDPGRGTKPLILKGTTLIPLRAFIEALGGTVEWNTFEQKVTIYINGKKMELWVGKNTAKVNGETKTLEMPPQGINGRIMLPLRFVAENLGLDVMWNKETGSILITER